MHLPTTNGEQCTRDGIKMGVAVGPMAIDLEWVQVHLTGMEGAFARGHGGTIETMTMVKMTQALESVALNNHSIRSA